MSQPLHHKQHLKAAYDLNNEYLQLSLHNNNEAYTVDLDEMIVDSRIVNINALEISKHGIKMDCSAPLIYDPESKDPMASMMRGITVVGDQQHQFMENIEHLAASLGEEWEAAVKRRKEEILRRNRPQQRI